MIEYQRAVKIFPMTDTCSMNLEDLVAQKKYLGTLEIQACYEGSSCDISENVLLSTKIPQPVCDWTTGLQGLCIAYPVLQTI